MANTTSAIRDRKTGVITIKVKSGVVMDVHGVPDGYQYEILDHDVESKQ